jgi:hypothetical protein
MEAADDSEEGASGGPTSGPIAYGAEFHAEKYPVYQVRQTRRSRSQWLAPPSHLSAATVITTAYWMFQVFLTFQVLHWQPQPAPAQRPASVSLSRCQAACKGVRIVPWSTDYYRESRRGVQRGLCQWPVRPAGGGAAVRPAGGRC